MQCHAGMESWWNDMWGGGGGGGNKGGRYRRRPVGHYRPIYITAPPIYSQSHHVSHAPQMFKKPSSFSYGGASNYGGHGLNSFGGFNSGYGSIGGHTSYGGSSSFGLGGFGSGSIQSYQPIQSYSSGHSNVAIKSSKGHSRGKQSYKSGGSSYGSSSGKSTHGFGPIKDDDLIIVEGGSDDGADYGGISIGGSSAGVSFESGIGLSQEFGGVGGGSGGGLVTHHSDGNVHVSGGGNSGIVEEVTNHIDDGAGKEGRLFDLSPPPVYAAGSNALGDSYAGHTIDGGAAALVSHGSQISDEIHASHSSQLPMAEHGTSSLTYLDESPAPLYPLHGASEGRSFQPSKQIPFPGQVYENHLSGSFDADTSQSSHSAVSAQATAYSDNSEAVVTYDAPLNYNDPIIEIVFEDAPTSYAHGSSFELDPSLYQPQSDDVEVYFIEVSDDETYQSIDDLDLSQALAGIKEEFPEGLPSELSQTLINSGYLDNAQIQVLDLDTALGDASLDDSLRLALRDVYGSGSNSIATIVEPDAPLPKQSVELRVKRLFEDKNTVEGDAELAVNLSKFPDARYGGIVELNDKDSVKFLPITVDGDRIPIPDNLELQGKKISGVLVYADKDANDNNAKRTANVVLSTETEGSSRTGRNLRNLHSTKKLMPQIWSDGDWKPMAPYISSEAEKL